MVVPIGKSGGVGMYNGWCLPGFAVVQFKSKGLFSDLFWGVVGLKMPEVNV